MENRKFEIDGNFEEEAIDINPDEQRSGGYVPLVLLIIFIVLFLTSSSMFVYFQFYQGDGKWHFSFKKAVYNPELIETLVDENRLLASAIDSLQQRAADINIVDEGAELFQSFTEGESYEVQIGYFRTYDFSQYEGSLLNLNADSEDGAVKLRIGRFSTFEEACRFRKDIVALGISGAFIAKKVDGKRVPFDKHCP